MLYQKLWDTRELTVGTTSLAEMLARLVDVAEETRRMLADGVEIGDVTDVVVESGLVPLQTTDPAVAEKWGMVEYEEGVEA